MPVALPVLPATTPRHDSSVRGPLRTFKGPLTRLFRYFAEDKKRKKKKVFGRWCASV